MEIVSNPKIIVANEEAVKTQGANPYYTNSTHLPVGYTDDIFEALKLQERKNIIDQMIRQPHQMQAQIDIVVM